MGQGTSNVGVASLKPINDASDSNLLQAQFRYWDSSTTELPSLLMPPTQTDSALPPLKIIKFDASFNNSSILCELLIGSLKYPFSDVKEVEMISSTLSQKSLFSKSELATLFPNLTRLNLSYNRFLKLPESIFSLPLRVLNLSNNQVRLKPQFLFSTGPF